MARRILRGLTLALLLAAGSTWSAPGSNTVTPPQPSWSQLSAEQQRILSPLANGWNSMEHYRRQKWLDIASRYPKLGPEEQARMQRRMQTWQSMPPEDREKARSQYKEFKQLPPDKKSEVKAQWERYNQLPEEEKLRLKQKSEAKSAPSERNPQSR